jgi:hypothetical protein
MKVAFFYLVIGMLLLNSCKKNDVSVEVFYKAHVFVPSTFHHTCGLNLAVDINFDGGTDVRYHAINLPDSSKLGDVLYIQYDEIEGVFECQVQGSVVGSPNHIFDKILITNYRN